MTATPPTLNIKFPPVYRWQADVLADTHRFRVVAASRRSGKNHEAALECLQTFFAGGIVWFITPDYPTGKPMFRLLQSLVKDIPGVEVNKAERIISAPDLLKGYIQVRSANAGLRGEGLDLVIFDEVIDIPNFTEIWQGDIMPTLATTNGRALFISSVFAFDDFWQLVVYAQTANDPEWRAWIIDAYQAGVIPIKEIEAQRRQMTESRFSREFGCQPMQVGSVFMLDRDNKSAIPDSNAKTGHLYIIGVDVGGSVDNTVAAVIDLTLNPVELCFLDVFLNPSFSGQIARIKDVWERFGQPTIIVESNNAGKAFIQDMEAAGIKKVRSLETTNATKANQVEALKLGFENHRIRVLDDMALLLELAAFERSKTPTGLVKYAASKGHDDRVMALLIAYAGCAPEPSSELVKIENPLFAFGAPQSKPSIFASNDRAEWEATYPNLKLRQR